MALDLDELLTPLSVDEPSGPDLADEAERMEIASAFDVEVSIDPSGKPADGSGVDWRAVCEKIAVQGRRTRDVWLPVYLCRAGVLSGSLETVELGARYLASLLEGFWPSLHPQLEEYGFQARKSACDSLAAHGRFIAPLRRLVLLRHPRLGNYSGDDFERFRVGGESEEGYGQFRTALQDTGDAGLCEIVGRIDAITDALKRADAVLTANADAVGATNFRPTYEALGEIRRGVQAFLTAPPAEEEAETSSADARGPVDAEPAPGGVGRVESREDVVRVLDAVCDYYRRREPAHPAPILLQRACEWVSLDFLEILADIAPGGLDEARGVLQSRKLREQ
jgi:type VI secretion system protein ImpA